MPIRPYARAFALLSALSLALAQAACAGLSKYEPVRVAVAGIEPLPGEGLELRFLVKLRVQNPNDLPLDFDGAFLEFDVRGEPFASGVSAASGSVPRYGEAVLAVPVTVSALHAVRQAIGAIGSADPMRLDYQLRGRLAGPGFADMRFETQGELAWPDAVRR